MSGRSPHKTPHHPIDTQRAPDSGAHDAVEEDIRTKQALLTAIVLLVLFGAGFWLVQEFHKSVTAQQCLEQGRRNCPSVEIRAR